MKILLLAVLFAASLLQSLAQAGVITGVGASTIPGTGSIGPVGATPAPNNDNAAPSPNAIPYSIFFNGAGLLEVEFVVANSAGTTEYQFNQFFVNNTGGAWTGFVFELGFGTGAGFTRLASSTSLDFDLPTLDPTPASSVFPTLDAQSTVLTWSGATLNAIGSVAFSFAIDVPDNLDALHPAGLNRFTLRQVPVVAPSPAPEPATAALVTIGLAALAAIARGRRKRGRGP